MSKIDVREGLTSQKASFSQIKKLAKIAASAGLDGIIASAKEAKTLKKEFKKLKKKLKIITPGIRNPKDQHGDQKRVATAKFAIYNGADYIVVGRPIISKPNKLKAACEILDS